MMNLSDYRKYVKNLDDATKEKILLEMYKNLPKDRKELFAINLQCIAEDKPLPEKDAVIPNLKKTEKKIDMIFKQAIYTYNIRPATRRKILKYIAEAYHDLIKTPPMADCFEEAMDQLERLTGVIQLASEVEEQIDFYSSVKLNYRDFYRTVLSKILSGSADLDRMKELMLRSVCRHLDDDLMVCEFMEIYLSLIRVGDTRFELFEYLEDFLIKRMTNRADDKEAKKEEYIDVRLGVLYLFLASEQTDLEDGVKQLQKICSPALCRKIMKLYKMHQHNQNSQEEERIRALEDQVPDSE